MFTIGTSKGTNTMDTQKLAAQILDQVGGAANVREVFHCVTRLRFYLNDRSLANADALKRIPGVLGVAGQTEQLQVIIGSEVDTVCQAVRSQLDSASATVDAKAKLADDVSRNKEEMKKFRIGGIFETVAAIILPVIPALAGTGILKGVLTIMTSYLGFTTDMDLIKVLTIASDVVFYFLPFFIAWSAAKRFKTDTAMAMVLAGCLLYPTMTAGLAEGAAPMSLFGLPIPFVKYASSSIPIILSVWVLKYVYAFVNKIMPKMLQLVFTPLVVALVMCPVTLGITGPVANYVSQGIAAAFQALFAFSPVLAGAVIGGTRSLLVFTGMHLSLGAVCLNNITQYGYDFILPVNTMGTLAIVGCCFGVWVKARKSENKEIGMSTFISSFIGITEPGIYGVLMVFRNVLIADIIAGAVAGAFVAFFGCTANAYVNSCILSLPVFVGPAFPQMCIGMAIAFALGAGLTIFFGFDEGDGEGRDLFARFKKQPADVEFAVAATDQPVSPTAAHVDSVEVVASPLSGEIVPLAQVDDPAFSSESLGRGVAVKPAEGVLTAPFDGTVTALYPSGHAIGITSDTGIECLIHIGMDTVNLGGKHFDAKVAQGDAVRCGQELLAFDVDAIKAAGYSLVTPVIVSNTTDFSDVFAAAESGSVARGDDLIKIIR